MAAQTRAQTLARITGALGERLLAFEDRSPRRVFAEIAPAELRDATRLMFEDLGARFQIASGIDTGEDIEVLYHWAFDRLGLVVTLRTRLGRDAPVLDSIARLCPAAEWIEREMWELLGIDFRDHPDLRHLLLDDDWPQGKYPLRRDYQR
ncbi:MAG: NADH-quinone oxidoreductase subunit C [Gammaproteobacteria bacterium]